MRIIFSVLVASICLLLGACSDGAKNDDEIRKNSKLSSEYKLLEGTYIGEVSNFEVGADPFPVQINIFIVQEQNGVNEHGEPKYRPALHGIYRRLDFPADRSNERSLLIRYYYETGEIVLGIRTPQAGPSSPETNFLSISGKYSNGNITGQIANSRGVLGTLRVSRVSQ